MVGERAVVPNDALRCLVRKVGLCMPLHLQVIACIPLALEPHVRCALRAEVLLAVLGERRQGEGAPCHERELSVAID